jgi:chromosome segregation ATPase
MSNILYRFYRADVSLKKIRNEKNDQLTIQYKKQGSLSRFSSALSDLQRDRVIAVSQLSETTKTSPKDKCRLLHFEEKIRKINQAIKDARKCVEEHEVELTQLRISIENLYREMSALHKIRNRCISILQENPDPITLSGGRQFKFF